MLFYLTFLLLVFIYNCSLERFIFSKSVEFMYLMNCLKFLLINSLLLNDHFPFFSTLFFRISLSFFSLSHWNIKRYTVFGGHSGHPIIFLCFVFYSVILRCTLSLNRSDLYIVEKECAYCGVETEVMSYFCKLSHPYFSTLLLTILTSSVDASLIRSLGSF